MKDIFSGNIINCRWATAAIKQLLQLSTAIMVLNTSSWHRKLCLVLSLARRDEINEMASFVHKSCRYRLCHKFSPNLPRVWCCSEVAKSMVSTIKSEEHIIINSLIIDCDMINCAIINCTIINCNIKTRSIIILYHHKLSSNLPGCLILWTFGLVVCVQE